MQTKLMEIMKAKRITAYRLAKLTGASRSTVWRQATGRRKMHVDDAILYARALGVSVSDLVG